MKNISIEFTDDELKIMRQMCDVVSVPGKDVEKFCELRRKIFNSNHDLPSLVIKPTQHSGQTDTAKN